MLFKYLFWPLILSAPFLMAEDSKEQEIYNQVVLKKVNTDTWKKIAKERYQDTYTVQEGDTLWDISQMLFGDSFLYNKVWSLNNQAIGNPHFIEPGMELRFVIGEEGQLPRLIVNKQEMPLFSSEGLIDLKPEEDAGKDLGFDEDGLTPTNIRLDYPISLNITDFVVEDEIPAYGEITGSLKEGVFFAPQDIIYLNYDPNSPVAAGQTFSIFRYTGTIKHPQFAKQSVGENAEFVGLARILSVNDERAEAVVTKAYGPITRGCYITRYIPPLANLELRYNPNLIKGFVVMGPKINSTLFAQGDTVQINRGIVDGVELGNIFYVMRTEDGLSGTQGYLNKVPVASIVMIDVQETTSTGLITKSAQEVYLGDPVETIP